MIGLSGTGERSKGFLVQFKSKHIGMVQRQLGVPADKDYTESGKERWKPNEKLVTMSSLLALRCTTRCGRCRNDRGADASGQHRTAHPAADRQAKRKGVI